MGTFWGSDYRFAQWGMDPALFERSPILLLQERLANWTARQGVRRWITKMSQMSRAYTGVFCGCISTEECLSRAQADWQLVP
jgi:hypothetical protein